jgi:pimeloyl-ACP methyl ester carboxylesterase
MRDGGDRPSRGPALEVVDIDGPIRYERWDGPPERTFVLIHGLGGSHLNWRLVAPDLARRGIVLVPDLPGHGLSPRAGRSSAVLAARRVVARFLERKASGHVFLAGNSMGGAIALLQAAFAPESVAGVIATSSVLPWARGGVPAPVVAGGFAVYRIPLVGDWAVRSRFEHLSAERTVRLGFRLATAHPERIPASLVRAHAELLRQRQRDPDAPAAFLEAARSILRLLRLQGPYRDALGRIGCPVLLVHGARDRFVPQAFARAAAGMRPGWRVVVIPDVGHVPQLEAPAIWLEAVADWLSGVEAGSGRAGASGSATSAR